MSLVSKRLDKLRAHRQQGATLRIHHFEEKSNDVAISLFFPQSLDHKDSITVTTADLNHFISMPSPSSSRLAIDNAPVLFQPIRPPPDFQQFRVASIVITFLRIRLGHQHRMILLSGRNYCLAGNSFHIHVALLDDQASRVK